MVVFLVNRCNAIKPDQTTTRLIQACLKLGHAVAVTDVLSLAVRSQTDVGLSAVVLTTPATDDAICEQARIGTRQDVPPRDISLIMVRTSPGRDLDHAWAHGFAIRALRLLQGMGVNVVNDPVGLTRASSKLYAACLPPELIPATLVGHTWQHIAGFMKDLDGPAVIKPILGTHGRDVFFVERPDEKNLRQLCELLGRTGYLVVQEYLPEAVEGDKRVLLLDGEILAVDGKEAVVKRVPRLGEFRSNVSLGAQAHPAQLTEAQRNTSRRAAEVLRGDNIRFSGLDLVGDKIIEINVYSTGGMVDAERFAGVDYGSAVMEALATPLCS